ncbi:hypothetical protein NUITMVA2_19750 [Aeromonas caviae]|nr:hypothetical protein NUITMVA2_19750 [Aeromonas caviae]
MNNEPFDTLYPPPVFTFRLFRLGDNYSDTGGLGTTHDGTDDKEHDINQVMFTIDLRASFFDKGKVFNQRHSACLLHGDAIRSQTICLFKFH